MERCIMDYASSGASCIPVGETRPKPPRVGLLFLKAGCKRAVLGTTILSNIWKGTVWSHRPNWPDRSNRTTLKAGPENSGRTKPKWSDLFDVPTEISGILGHGKRPWLWKTWSPGRIEMELFIPVEIFRKKGIPFEDYLFPFFTETIEIFCTICLVY